MAARSADSFVLQKKISSSKKVISTALQALPSRLSSHKSISTSALIPPPIPGLYEIVSQLVSNVRHTTTSLALAFKPPALPDAVNQQLDKLVDQYGRLASCAIAISVSDSGSEFGSTSSRPGSGSDTVLVEEWTDGISSIGRELERFLNVLEDGISRNNTGETASSSKEESPYLQHTGMVWEAIDRFTKNMSKDEVSAVVKRLEEQKEVFKDAWTEFKGFLEDQEDSEEDQEDGEDDEDEQGGAFEADEDLDDEWGQLERAMQGKKMTLEERRRAEAAKPLLGLHQLLHASIPRYVPLLIIDPDQTYRPLINASSSVLAAFDSAVSAMYPEQDQVEIESTLEDLANKSKAVVEEMKRRLNQANQNAEGSCKGDPSQRQICRAFLDKWVMRLEVEMQSWHERRLSLSSLKDSL